LRITKIEKELRIAKQEGVLNIQPLALKLPPHSSSSLECVKGKAYDENIHFVQTIIQDINTTRTYVVEFLDISKRHWCPKEQIGPRATSIDPMFIEELEDDERVEQHFVEEQTMEKDTREANIIEVEEHLSLEV
jgi:hypothetical protein